jgi:hypothetical protein
MRPDHKFFHKALLDDNPSCITGESTPSYLLHSDVVLPRVKAFAPHAKLIVMLRDPVARAYSQVSQHSKAQPSVCLPPSKPALLAFEGSTADVAPSTLSLPAVPDGR